MSKSAKLQKFSFYNFGSDVISIGILQQMVDFEFNCHFL